MFLSLVTLVGFVPNWDKQSFIKYHKRSLFALTTLIEYNIFTTQYSHELLPDIEGVSVDGAPRELRLPVSPGKLKYAFWFSAYIRGILLN